MNGSTDAVRILHLADVHLDRPFVGLSRESARQRRVDLFDTFRRCLVAAGEQRVDVVTVGGDLWEDENVTPDTRASVAHELGSLGIPVYVVTGNHDPYLRGGAYQRTHWPANVTIVDSPDPTELRVSADVSVWGLSWTGPPLIAGFLRTFRVPDDGRTHLLLMHGTAIDQRFAGSAGHCQFAPADARRAGFALVLAGHIHAASHLDDVVYPGSPEPLDHSETGRHCYALVTCAGDPPEVELVDVNRRRYLPITVDCTDATSSSEVESRVRDALPSAQDGDAIVRVRLIGETAPDCTVDSALLRTRLEESFMAASVLDETEPRVDYTDMARRHSADGLFVASMLDRIAQAGDDPQREVLEMALRAGVRAMSGRDEVLSVG